MFHLQQWTVNSKLTTDGSNAAIAYRNIHTHLLKVFRSTPPARLHSGPSFIYNFRNINVHMKCSSVPPDGIVSVVANKFHNAKATMAPQPKYSRKSLSSDWVDRNFHGSRPQIIRAWNRISATSGLVVLILFLFDSASSAIVNNTAILCERTAHKWVDATWFDSDSELQARVSSGKYSFFAK